MNPNVEKFLAHVADECVKHNVTLAAHESTFVEASDNIKCSGYFADGTEPEFPIPTLAFASGASDWLEVLVHEYAHMTQWLEGESFPLWKQAGESLTYVWEWLAGTDYEDIMKHIAVARDLELDNEKRSVALMKEWNLPIDTDHYTKKCNAYVIFYNYLAETRKWSDPSNAPYRNPRILEAMSVNFDMEYAVLGQKMKDLYASENI